MSITLRILRKFIKMYKISASESGTTGMVRTMRACANELLALVTEGVVHGAYKVLIRLSFGLSWRHKVSGGTGCFSIVSQLRLQTSHGS